MAANHQGDQRIEDRLIELELENARLQRLVVELLTKNQQLRDAHLFNLDRKNTNY